MLKALILVLYAVSGAAGAEVRVQEYPIPPGHGVHDVWADANPGGPIWFSAQGSGYANLNTAIFDRKGVHWFTGQSGIYGRLDPRTGKWSAWRAPATQRFESFRSSARSSNVRQIHGRKGEVWTPESAADRITVYRY